MVGKVNKHTFEAVSLLILNKGQIEVTVIPVEGQLDWIVPSNMILEVVDLSERIWMYQWNHCDIAVYHLLESDSQPTKLVILEGSSDVHRVGLQITGELTQKQVGISQVKDLDAETSDISLSLESNPDAYYIFQQVWVDDVAYIVPDLDELAHRLVDLDG